MTIIILLTALCIMLASLVGIIFSERTLKGILQRNLAVLVSFSIGVFLVITFSLTKEALHESFPPLYFILTIAGGILLLELGGRMIPSAHHHHDPVHDHSRSKLDARRMMLGDAIHNIGDGILLVPAFLVDIHVGLATAGAILIHEVVQEISEYFILKESGYTTTQALSQNFLVSSTILIGVGLSLALASADAYMAGLSAFAAGGFLYIIFRDLVPNTYDSIKKKGGWMPHLTAIILGIALMSGVQFIAPHEHGHEDEEHHEEHLEEPIALSLRTGTNQ